MKQDNVTSLIKKVYCTYFGINLESRQTMGYTHTRTVSLLCSVVKTKDSN